MHLLYIKKITFLYFNEYYFCIPEYTETVFRKPQYIAATKIYIYFFSKGNIQGALFIPEEKRKETQTKGSYFIHDKF